MKNMLAGFAMATMLFGMAGFAYSSTRSAARQSGVTPAQFRALKVRVAKLEKTTGSLATYTVNCLFKWQGVARFGQPPSNGYVYDSDNNPTNGQFLASALDLTDAGETPQAYFVSTQDTNCIPTGLALNRTLRQFRATTTRSTSVSGALGARVPASPYGQR